MTLQSLDFGRCSNCGSASLTLAVDTVLTDYCDVSFVDGAWIRGDRRTELDTDTTPDPVRIFCSACCTYHEVPEELET